MKKAGILFLLISIFLIGCGSETGENAEPSGTVQATNAPEASDISDKPLIGLTDFCDVSVFCNDSEYGQIYVYIPIAVREDVKEVAVDAGSWDFGGSEILEWLYSEAEEIYDYYRLSCIRLLITYPSEACEIKSLSLLLDGEPVEYEFGRLYGTELVAASEGDDPSVAFAACTFEVPEACLRHVPGDALRFHCDAELTGIQLSSDELVIDTEQLQDILTDYYEEDYVRYDLYFLNPDSRYHFFETACSYKLGQSREYGVRKVTPTRNKMDKCMKNLLDEKYGTTETE